MMEFLTSCVLCSMSDVPDLEAMMDGEEEIDHDTFRDELGHDAYQRFAEELGYGSGMRLQDDWHVSYHRSTFKGQPVVYCVHSAIEYIFAAPNQAAA